MSPALPQGIRVVPIAEEHIEGFHRALDAVARERRFLALLEAPPLPLVGRVVRESIAAGVPRVVAIVEDGVVGWCDVMPDSRPASRHVGVLGMGVVREHRGRGVGAALLTSALAAAREAGLTRVELTVREDNAAAIRLYERFGFVHEGLKRNALAVDGRFENLACMALLLDDAPPR